MGVVVSVAAVSVGAGVGACGRRDLAWQVGAGDLEAVEEEACSFGVDFVAGYAA